MSRRVWITALLLFLMQLGVVYVQQGYAPAAVVLPSYQVTDLPAQFEGWQSQAIETDIRIARAAGADATMERVYSQPNKPKVSAHFGLWSDAESRAPHLPQACYSGGGWNRLDQEVLHFGDGSKAKVVAALITWERDGERVRTLHWYRRGDRTFFDWDEGCQVRRELWGKSNWPAIEKVLLQTVDDNKDDSRARLIALASEINRWMLAAR
jgi:hypothetical protein